MQTRVRKVAGTDGWLVERRGILRWRRVEYHKYESRALEHAHELANPCPPVVFRPGDPAPVRPRIG